MRGEHRWPMALAVLAVAGLHALLPDELRFQSSGILLWSIVLALVVLIVLDPGRIDRIQAASRVLTDVIIGLLTVANAYAAVMLVVGIVNNDSFADAQTLLYSGASVWVTNVILFALWYWDLDRGGAAERARNTGRSPAFATSISIAVRPAFNSMSPAAGMISPGIIGALPSWRQASSSSLPSSPAWP